MSAESIIKSQARGILKKNFVKALIALLIVLIPVYMIDGATTILSCAMLNYVSDEQLSTILIYSIGYPLELVLGFLFSPLINGYVRAYYKASYTEEIDLKDVFYHFRAGRYGSALNLNIRLLARMILPILILYAPLIVFDILCSERAPEFYGTILYNNIYFALAVIDTIIITLYSLRYFTVFTVSADNPQFTAKEVFLYNKRIMKDNTGAVAKLIFSFTPWLLLSLLVLPLLYVIPYMTQSLCVSAKWITLKVLEEKQ